MARQAENKMTKHEAVDLAQSFSDVLDNGSFDENLLGNTIQGWKAGTIIATSPESIVLFIQVLIQAKKYEQVLDLISDIEKTSRVSDELLRCIKQVNHSKPSNLQSSRPTRINFRLRAMCIPCELTISCRAYS